VFAQLPFHIRQAILVLLECDDFRAAKKLYATWIELYQPPSLH
jgi:hypothetical protein